MMDGIALSEELLAETADKANSFLREVGRRPRLAAVLVGNDPASVTYVKMKRARCERVGIEPWLISLPPTASTSEAVEAVRRLSDDPTVDGILVQHPVPPHVDERAVFEAIAVTKDVDGVTTRSFAAMAFGLPGFVSCTPGGIMRLLDAYGVGLAGRHAAVIGRSPILGKPTGMLLLARDATVTYCHSHTEDLPSVVRDADIVVAGVGRQRFARGDWLKPGAVVIDAGYDGKVGDVDLDEAVGVASLLTPVPGGVGPMTIAVLLAQTIVAAQSHVRDGKQTDSTSGSWSRLTNTG